MAISKVVEKQGKRRVYLDGPSSHAKLTKHTHPERERSIGGMDLGNIGAVMPPTKHARHKGPRVLKRDRLTSNLGALDHELRMQMMAAKNLLVKAPARIKQQKAETEKTIKAIAEEKFMADVREQARYIAGARNITREQAYDNEPAFDRWYRRNKSNIQL